MAPELEITLRERREAAGLSQQALAAAVGITRQSLLAAERGRQVPSTAIALRLAHVLGCRVEDLFHLGADSSVRAWMAGPRGSTASGRVVLGRVDGRWVAHPIAFDSSTAADAVGEPPASAAGWADLAPMAEPALLESNVLVAGCAPPLGMLAHRLTRPGVHARLRWLSHGSGRALDELADGLVHVAGLHLHDVRRGEDNIPFVRRRFRDRRMLVVNLVGWSQGIVTAPGNPRRIRGLGDLLRPRLRVARRERGAGASKLLRRGLSEHGPRTDDALRGPEVAGHLEVAQAVALGAADAGIAIEAVARALGLEFLPLSHERFDLVLPAERASEAPVARMLAAIDDPSFRRELARLPGYDTTRTGHALTLDPEAAK